MGKNGGIDRLKCGLWQQISGENYAPSVSQTLQKGGNTECAMLSLVPHAMRVLLTENLPQGKHEKVGPNSENCLFECCVLLRL